MERFWQWLMRANARGVFVATVAAFLLVAGWWVRQEINPPEDGLPSGGGGARPAKARVHLDILDYVQAQLAVDPALVPETPFRPAREPRRRLRRGDPNEFLLPSPERPPLPPSPPVVPVVATPVTPPPTPAGPVGDAGPRSVTLIYRGIFKRSDGHTLALIEDSENNRRIFRDVGQTVDDYGTAVRAVTIEGVSLATSDGEVIELPLGEANSFVEGRHVKQPDTAAEL